jgi:hypothetical protein
MPFSKSYVEKANQVFLNPSSTYSWDSIIKGADVKSENGNARRISAVAQNTYRGFHRIDQTRPGAKEGFEGYFLEEKNNIINRLVNITTHEELHGYSNEICTDLRGRLRNCKQEQLKSYNKLRKPIDLYIEHLVAMATELTEHRTRLVPLLYLPLDSQIFAHRALFSDRELSLNGLNRHSTYQSVNNEARYCALQKILVDKARAVENEQNAVFYVIYFDLIWNSRYNNWGGNLFETNP